MDNILTNTHNIIQNEGKSPTILGKKETTPKESRNGKYLNGKPRVNQYGTRPKIEADFRRLLVSKGKNLLPKAWEILDKALDHDDFNVKLQAVKIIFDRVYGKPRVQGEFFVRSELAPPIINVNLTKVVENLHNQSSFSSLSSHPKPQLTDKVTYQSLEQSDLPWTEEEA